MQRNSNFIIGGRTRIKGLKVWVGSRGYHRAIAHSTGSTRSETNATSQLAYAPNKFTGSNIRRKCFGSSSLTFKPKELCISQDQILPTLPKHPTRQLHF